MMLIRWILRVLPFAYMGFIWVLSSHPHDAVINTGLSFDAKLKEALHLIEFAALYVLWILFFAANKGLTARTVAWAIALACTYGLVDELHQYFVPSRSFSWIDIVKDVVGVMAVHVVFTYLRRKRHSCVNKVLNAIRGE